MLFTLIMEQQKLYNRQAQIIQLQIHHYFYNCPGATETVKVYYNTEVMTSSPAVVL